MTKVIRPTRSWVEGKVMQVEKHEFHEDPKKSHALCAICKLPEHHPVHKLPTVKGVAVPTKLG